MTDVKKCLSEHLNFPGTDGQSQPLEDGINMDGYTVISVDVVS